MSARRSPGSNRKSSPPAWLETIAEATANLDVGIAKLTDMVMHAISEELVALKLDGSLGESDEAVRRLVGSIVKRKTMDLVVAKLSGSTHLSSTTDTKGAVNER